MSLSFLGYRSLGGLAGDDCARELISGRLLTDACSCTGSPMTLVSVTGKEM